MSTTTILPYAQPIPALLSEPGCTQPISLKRREGAYVGAGVWKDDASVTTVNGRGIVYPSTSDDLAALPEGERTIKSLTLYWRLTFAMNDRIQYDGEEYRVVKIEPFTRYGYNKAIAQVNQIE